MSKVFVNENPQGPAPAVASSAGATNDAGNVLAIAFMCVLLLALAILGNSARAQTVIDGDTIKLNGTSWRLWGIDAPESRQFCGRYPAGARATEMLEQLMRSKSIDCEERGTDRYGRTIGLCRANGDDLGATMVRLGMAWAFVRYSRDYVEQEAKAKANNLGVHAHQCVPAWEWRAQLRGDTRHRHEGIDRLTGQGRAAPIPGCRRLDPQRK